jgi:hypothetical protein
MYVLYYASMLRCWHLIWILVRTEHPCLGVVCHIYFVFFLSFIVISTYFRSLYKFLKLNQFRKELFGV